MLCSRAITRERAAMSGSIAAFVLNGLSTPRISTVNVELTSASSPCNAKSITCKVQFVNLASLGRMEQQIMFRMRPLSIPGMLALLVLLVVPVSHYAQAEVARAGNDANVPPVAKPESDIAHKLELLEEQMRAQNGRIDQLTALVAEQQRLINQLIAARGSNPTTSAGDAAPSTVASTPWRAGEQQMR